MQAQQGFSLVEVMVAGVVTTTGLAGIAGLLLTSVAHTSGAHERTLAALEADQLSSMMTMTPAAALAYLEEPQAIAPDCSSGLDCDAAQFAAYNLKRWHIEVASSLPGGQGLVCRDSTPEDGSPDNVACDGSGPLVIKLFWREPGDEPTSVHRFALRVPQ